MDSTSTVSPKIHIANVCTQQKNYWHCHWPTLQEVIDLSFVGDWELLPFYLLKRMYFLKTNICYECRKLIYSIASANDYSILKEMI